MVRRDFLKNTAFVAATAAMYSPLSAASSDESANQKIIAVVSESAHETGYVIALAKGNKVDEVIMLGSDNLKNMHTLASAISSNKGSTFFGLLAPSDHALLNQVAMSNGASFVSETAHTPSNIGVRHTENSFAVMSVKKVFDEFASANTDKYGMALSSYHTIGAHNTVAIAKQTDFASEHIAKNAFVSFVLKA
ncbi:hypothetical protein [Sulfuricurvum sp.]|uniref:hypothetical protein n=1 Tax=Sulfuricurvum sp. TaxID=2025608 RepID=UPI0025F4D52F|nr:hypothetical protein [Sulfuricurvum sp.]